MTENTDQTLGVRELLDLERNLYQENINRNEQIHEQLLKGDLPEFKAQCQPLKRKQNISINIAKAQLQLSKQNALQLLQVEIQQAKEVCRNNYEEYKVLLMKKASSRQKRLQTKLLRIKAQSHKNKVSAVNNLHLVCEGVRRDELESKLHEIVTKTKKVFNFQLLENSLPPPSTITQIVADEAERYHNVQAKIADNSKVYVSVDCLQQILSIESKKTNKIEHFYASDEVLLLSIQSGAEFYGQLLENMTKDLVLIQGGDGVLIQVPLACLQAQLCIITHICKTN